MSRLLDILRRPWVQTLLVVVLAVEVLMFDGWARIVVLAAWTLGSIADVWTVHFLRRLSNAQREALEYIAAERRRPS